jgi:hypothetical protein
VTLFFIYALLYVVMDSPVKHTLLSIPGVRDPTHRRVATFVELTRCCAACTGASNLGTLHLHTGTASMVYFLGIQGN